MDDASIQAKVPQLRKRFLSKYEGSILDDTFDARDVKRVKEDDAYLRCFLRSPKTQGDVEKTADILNTALEWRAKVKMTDCTEADLHPDIKAKNFISYKGVDLEDHKILMVRVKTQKKGVLLDEQQKCLVYNLEQHFRVSPEKQITILFDFTDAGVSNLDMDFSKFIVTATAVYFPNIVARYLMFKMGTALEAVYKIIQSWMEPDQKKRTFFVKRSNIQEYVHVGQLEPHMIKETK